MDRSGTEDEHRREQPGTLPAKSSRRGILYGAALARLRDMITSGSLASGHHLREQELCDELGVSRTPLREAIRTLATEGLVELLPNRGAVVAGMNAKEVGALYQVVGALECLAAELACERITDQEVTEFGALHELLVRHHRQANLKAYFEVNQAIHRRLVEVAANPVLLWVWDMLALRVNRARYSTNLRPDRWAEAVREHEALLKALSARNGAQLVLLLRQHFDRGLRSIEPDLPKGSQAPEGLNQAR